MNETLGAKRICPDCGAKFYDLNATPVICVKCSHELVIAKPNGAVAKPVATQAKPKPRQKEKEEELKGMGDVMELESLDDFDDDLEHLEEVEEHHEAPEVDMNSDDADDDMFMGEIAKGDTHLVDDPDGGEDAAYNA